MTPDTDKIYLFPPLIVQILHAENHWLTIARVHASLVRVYDTMKYTTTSDVQCQIVAIMQSSSKLITLQYTRTAKRQ